MVLVNGTYYETCKSLTHSADGSPQHVLMALMTVKQHKDLIKPSLLADERENGNKKATNITVRLHEYTIIHVLLSCGSCRLWRSVAGRLVCIGAADN